MRKYRVGDENGIIDLLRLVYGKEQFMPSDWGWCYKDNPLGNFIGVAETCDGQIVGHMALIPTLVKVCDRIEKGSQAVGLTVHPNFRRQGMFLAIGRYLTGEAGKDGIDFTFGFPNEAAHRGHLKYSFFDVGHVIRLTKILNGSTLLKTSKVNNVLKKIGVTESLLHHCKPLESSLKLMFGLALRVVNIFHRVAYWIRYNVNLETLEVKEVKSLDGRVDDFWRTVSTAYDIIVVRNKEYLDWRYFRQPSSKYAFLIAEQGNTIVGYTVLSTKTGKLNYGLVMDFLIERGNVAIAQLLISEAIKYFRRRNIDLVIFYAFRHEGHYKVLRNKGFIPISKAILIARVNSPRMSNARAALANCSKWYITLGDIL